MVSGVAVAVAEEIIRVGVAASEGGGEAGEDGVALALRGGASWDGAEVFGEELVESAGGAAVVVGGVALDGMGQGLQVATALAVVEEAFVDAIAVEQGYGGEQGEEGGFGPPFGALHGALSIRPWIPL